MNAERDMWYEALCAHVFTTTIILGSDCVIFMDEESEAPAWVTRSGSHG